MESLPDFSEKISKTYAILTQIAPILVANQGKNVIGGAYLVRIVQSNVKGRRLYLKLRDSAPLFIHHSEYPAAVFIQTGPDDYPVAGRGLTIRFTPNTPGDPSVGIIKAEEGVFNNGNRLAGRRLNGDEILSGKGLQLDGNFTIQYVKLYRYK